MSKMTPGNSILDISDYYIPLDLTEVFGNKKELVLEIGFGDGDFIIEMAQKNPKKNFLGIEIKTRRFKFAVKKAEEKKYKNLKFIHMNACIAVEELFTKDTFSQVYINFPDPWPKDRHIKHRIVNTGVLQRLSKIMKADGILEIASDDENYVAHSLDVFNETSFFKSVYPPPGFLHDVPNRPYTRYEKEFRKEGREIFYLMFTNNK